VQAQLAPVVVLLSQIGTQRSGQALKPPEFALVVPLLPFFVLEKWQLT
jgi:hypothetical protein